MGIDKIGPNIIHTPHIHPKDETHKMIHRHNNLREDSYTKAAVSEYDENMRIKTESVRISDMNKVNRKGLNAPAPNVHHYGGSYKEGILFHKEIGGKIFDVII